MKLNINIWYKQNYLPSKRHRNEKHYMVEDTIEVEIQEPSAEAFPVAFIVSKYELVDENAKKYKDFEENGNFRIFGESIRTYNGKLYKPVRITYGAVISTCFVDVANLHNMLSSNHPSSYEMGEEIPENAVLTSDNKEKVIADVKEQAERYVVYDNIIWKKCNEPCYKIQTFGLGNNHGGTDFFIEYLEPGKKWPMDNYFNALQREEAITYGKRVAERRGDTEDVGRMGKDYEIQVLIPEMVSLDPQRDYRLQELKTFKEVKTFSISFEGLKEVLKELQNDSSLRIEETTLTVLVVSDNNNCSYEMKEVMDHIGNHLGIKFSTYHILHDKKIIYFIE